MLLRDRVVPLVRLRELLGVRRRRTAGRASR